MISCKQLSELSSDYLDGNLTLAQRLSVRLHTLMCKYCRRFLSQLNISTALLPKDNTGDLSEADIETQLAALVAKPDE